MEERKRKEKRSQPVPGFIRCSCAGCIQHQEVHSGASFQFSYPKWNVKGREGGKRKKISLLLHAMKS
jgi:hypothetical protein